MTNPYAQFETDKNLEAGEGVTLDYGGYSITINRAGGANKKYQKAMAEKLTPYRAQQETGSMDPDLANRLVVEAFVEGAVLGWNGVKDRDGKPLKFTQENAVKLFLDLPALFDDIYERAHKLSTFRVKQEEIEEKN